MFIVQSALIRTRNMRLHRSLGPFGAVLGAFMVPLGISIAVIMGRFHIHQLHEAAAGYEAPLISPFYDMAAFGILLGLAVYWRRKADWHRRLMLMATCGLTTAAIARFPRCGYSDQLQLRLRGFADPAGCTPGSHCRPSGAQSLSLYGARFGS